jgi:hypothetical protein
MPYCDSQGNIPMDKLIKPLKAPNNNSFDVYVMLVVLIAGFAVKVLAYSPALFRPYSHSMAYDPMMTEHFRYIAVAIPTAGENKACVLRNMVGAVSCIPRHCTCRYHVVLADEGHRVEQKKMWEAFCKVLEELLAMLDKNPIDINTEKGNVDVPDVRTMFRAFMKIWVEETKKMTLEKLNDSKDREIADKFVKQLSGTTTIARVKQEDGRWKRMCSEQLLAACQSLEEHIKDKKKKKQDLHLDDCESWPPHNQPMHPAWPKLYVHYCARAKPPEDDRAMRVQRVAIGTWFYEVPPEATVMDWLPLRQKCRPVEVGDDNSVLPSQAFRVPMQTSRGKAGGLNFVANYLRWYSERFEKQAIFAKKACLFSICDARHQYQVDFMHATIPVFFSKKNKLMDDVGFAQSPQYFPEMADATDFLDTNNAQFFRLNCMLRNCVGGVSSCGTNGTWRLNIEFGQSIWERSEGEGKDMSLCERRIFGESCKVEDTASSLDCVLKGNRSQYVNRYISYGMAKDPMDYLAAVQRWAEGGVVLSMQTYFDFKQPGVQLVWLASLLYFYFFASTIRAVIFRAPDWFVLPTYYREILIKWVKGYYSQLTEHLKEDWPDYYRNAYENLLAETTVWLMGLFAMVVVVFLVTQIRCCGRRRLWPRSMRMWGRLLISVDNITYFLWCWVAFGWIALNMTAVFVKRAYDFDSGTIIYFCVIIQVLTWGLLISANARYAMQSSTTANEVIFLSLNNIWRGTQLFYMCAPLQVYSILVGALDYLRYRNFGEDISFWVGGDRGAVSRNIVQYWTLFILLLVLTAWVYYFTEGDTSDVISTLPSVIIVTTIGLDVLHPCTFLWLSDYKKLPEHVSSARWYWKPLYLRWWQYKVFHAICNATVAGIFRWIGPVQHVLIPIAALFLPALGIHGAFLLVVTSK